MIRVPAQFAEWHARFDGHAGREWVRSLPGLVERLAGRWDLVVDDAEPMHGTFSLAVLVHRAGEPLVLRLSRRDETTENEAVALRAWRGRGAVRLHEADPEVGAVLMERLDHTRSLHALPLREAAEVAGGLIRTLAIAPTPGLSTLRSVAEGIVASLPRRQRALDGPVPPKWLDAACRNAAELGPAGEQVLIHADLHYGNVLAGTRRPWLAVDPRPLCGAPEYSVPELMWNRADDLRTGAEVRGLLDVLVRAGELDASLAHGWTVTRAVDYWLWGLERGLTIDPARCERVLAALCR